MARAECCAAVITNDGMGQAENEPYGPPAECLLAECPVLGFPAAVDPLCEKIIDTATFPEPKAAGAARIRFKRNNFFKVLMAVCGCVRCKRERGRGGTVTWHED